MNVLIRFSDEAKKLDDKKPASVYFILDRYNHYIMSIRAHSVDVYNSTLYLYTTIGDSDYVNAFPEGRYEVIEIVQQNGGAEIL